MTRRDDGSVSIPSTNSERKRNNLLRPPYEMTIRLYPTLIITAYGHELVHFINGKKFNDTDPDHSNGNGLCAK